jgi:dihydroorotase-like cyclic amidohydrolase
MMNAVNQGRFDLERYVQVSSANPARTWGLYGRKGVIAPGADADLVLVDMDRTETLTSARLASRGKVSAYEGMAVKGWPVATLVRGRIVAKDGRVCAEPGWGKPVVQKMPPPKPRNLDKHLATLCRHSPA